MDCLDFPDIGKERNIKDSEGKGVYREVESVGSWMWVHTNPLADLWSDEQKSHQSLFYI